jgi:hypothetical protein
MGERHALAQRGRFQPFGEFVRNKEIEQCHMAGIARILAMKYWMLRVTVLERGGQGRAWQLSVDRSHP